MKRIVLAVCMMAFVAGSARSENKPKLAVFYAPCYSPVMSTLIVNIEKIYKVSLQNEVKGSQVLCRQVAELGRGCDLMMLADAELFKTLAGSKVSWRLEFAHDEVVLGVGIRAKRTDEAEKNWVTVLKDPAITLGRVNENLGPIGYRTLLVWKLKEKLGFPGLFEALRTKKSKILDHADHLAAILKMGEADYGFLYKTTCLQTAIRFISLEPPINLGRENIDYSKAEVTYSAKKGGQTVTKTVAGSVVTYGLSIPDGAANPGVAKKVVEYLLVKNAERFKEKGYIYYKPKFYGSKEKYKEFSGFADYAGQF